MDVTCATCREPWDNYHMQHDAIWETDLPENIIRHVSEEGTKLNFPGVREALKRDGWEFGSSVLAIMRCPCCPSNEANNGTPDSEDVANRKMQRAVLAGLLGDDEDGLASMLEDLEG